MPIEAVILDTNIFVAAGFNPHSNSARIIQTIREGRLRLIWHEDTRDEIEHTIRKIPVLTDDLLEGLFEEEHRYSGELHLESFQFISDPADRKFAALAAAAHAPLVSADDHLLQWRHHIPAPVLRPGEFLDQYPLQD